ncbi:MAG: O-antigen ligase family protein [Solirubrobacterales bacterium]|nr:O-antigen ligase family protein [Solirubrobacterales bacterium]
MIERLSWAPTARTWGIAGALALCVIIGLASGIEPALGVAAAFGIVFAAATVADVAVGVVLFTLVSFLDIVSSGGASLTKLAGLLLFGSWYATTLSRHRSRSASLSRAPPLLTISCVALLVWSAFSIIWAYGQGDAVTSTTRFALNMLLIPIVLAATRRREHLLWMMAAFLGGAVISSIVGFVGAGTSVSGRLSGSGLDPNELAAVLVAAIPMAMALTRALRARPEASLACAIGGLICLAGAIDTLSRGGLVALGAMLVAGVVIGGRWRGIAVVLLAITTFGTLTYYLVLAPQAARQRVEMADTNGRTDLWAVGRRMVDAHPVRGVGSGNFQVAEIHYLQQPGTITRADLIVDDPHVAHDIYLELAADLGLPGFVLLATIMLTCLWAALRAARNFSRRGDTEMELIARSLALSLLAFMVADVFLSGEFSKQLWLVFAFCAATLALSRTALSAVPTRTASAPGTGGAALPAIAGNGHGGAG